MELGEDPDMQREWALNRKREAGERECFERERNIFMWVITKF